MKLERAPLNFSVLAISLQIRNQFKFHWFLAKLLCTIFSHRYGMGNENIMKDIVTFFNEFLIEGIIDNKMSQFSFMNDIVNNIVNGKGHTFVL